MQICSPADGTGTSLTGPIENLPTLVILPTGVAGFLNTCLSATLTSDSELPRGLTMGVLSSLLPAASVSGLVCVVDELSCGADRVLECAYNCV